MTTSILNVPADSPLNDVPEALKLRLVTAQSDALELEFKSAHDLCARALSDLKIAVRPPKRLAGRSAADFGDMAAAELIATYSEILARNGVPEQAISLQAANLVHRTQLLRAFRDPDGVISVTCSKVAAVVRDFPKTAADIRCGRNPGDVLDPYILGAAQALMCAGDFEHTISATVAHKILMIIEGCWGICTKT